jgi:S-DNA-T family DNA segregation ATPase FtsK/SpoIIIE
LLSIALFTLAAQHDPETARFYILDGRPDTPYIDRLRQRERELRHNVTIIDRHRLSSLLTEINDEIKDRAGTETDQKPPVYLLIYGLHNFRALRYEEKTPSSLTRQFSSLLRNGPEQGIHTLIWCDMLNNFSRSVEGNILDEFELRIAFQMSENDSTKLIHSTEANRLDPHRALLFKARERVPEKFIPYESPTNEWLKQTVDFLRQK